MQIVSEEPKGKSRKQIQAGQDWSESETWYGLALTIIFTGIMIYLFIQRWDSCSGYYC